MPADETTPDHPAIDLEDAAAMETSPTMLLSRVAQNLYWAGRYLERAEATSRLVRTHTELFVDLPRSAGVTWAPLLAVTGSGESYRHGREAMVEEDVVSFLLADPRHQGSVVSSLGQARENFRVTRGLIPRRSWESVNDVHRWARSTAATASARATRVRWTEEVIHRCHTLLGSVVAMMSRDHAYAFLEVGRLVERADMTTRVLDVQAGILMGPGSGALGHYVDQTWMSMLRSLGGEQMYRRRMGGEVSPTNAVRFLLRDASFPRSVEHCLIEISRWLLELPDQAEPMAGSAAVQRLLDGAPVEDCEVDGLHAFVDAVQLGLGDLHDRIEATYFPSQDLANA
ncbi:MAG: alpha-E domain-containing protein [Acidimicrobiia bacterium]